MSLRCAFIGSATLDVVLRVPAFPKEDDDARCAPPERRLGGNAANSAVAFCEVASLLCGAGAAGIDMAVPPPPPPPCLLLAATTDAAADADGRFVAEALARRGVSPGGLVVVAPSGLPVSHIILSTATGSRTIMHHRSMRELSREEMVARLGGLGGSGCGGGGGGGGDGDGGGGGGGGGGTWLHFESRSPAVVEAMLELRAAARTAGTPSPVLSVEIEKPKHAFSLDAPFDAFFVSRAFATAVLGADGPESAIAAVRRRVPAGALIVVPWGERGAWASAPGAGESWVCFPGHAPLSGPVVDTIGAGDTFIGAVLAYAALEPAAAALARGECVARTEGVLRAWLGFACCVAGEKCSQHGITIGASGAESVRAAFRARWAEAAAAT